MKKIILSLVLIFGVFLGGVSFGKNLFNLDLDPLKFEITGKRGDKIVKTIKIKNVSDKDLELKVQKYNISQKENGNAISIYIKNKNLYPEENIIKWISYTKDKINIKSGETKNFTFIINIPKDGEIGGHYGVIFFGYKDRGKDKKVGININYGTLILLKVDGKNFTKKAKINSVNLVNNENNLEFNINVQNLGDIHFKPKVKIKFFNEKGNQIKHIGVKKIVNTNGIEIGQKFVDYIYTSLGNILPGRAVNKKIIFKGIPYIYFDDEGKMQIMYNKNNIFNKKIRVVIELEDNFNILDKKEYYIYGFSIVEEKKGFIFYEKNLSQAKNTLKNTEYEKYIKIIDNFFNKMSDEKIKKSLKIIEKIDLSSPKFKKYKDLFVYIKAKIEFEIYKRGIN